ncbi:MAG: hypothetical protein ACUVQH_14095, partial [Thermogutta sp.]
PRLSRHWVNCRGWNSPEADYHVSVPAAFWLVDHCVQKAINFAGQIGWADWRLAAALLLAGLVPVLSEVGLAWQILITLAFRAKL